MVVALKSDLATVGFPANGPRLEKLAEIRLVVFFAIEASFSRRDSSEPQSLIPGTMMKVSLRVKSAPREFLMGPIGPEIVGRCFFPFEAFDEVESRSLLRLLKPELGRVVAIMLFGCEDDLG